MTRHGKKTRITVALMVVTESIAIYAAYMLHRLTKAKLGLLRHLVYLNGKWEKAYDIGMIRNGILLFAGCVLLYAAIRKTSSVAGRLVMIASSLMTAGYILMSGKASDRAYYGICIILTAGFLLEFLIWLLSDRKKKSI